MHRDDGGWDQEDDGSEDPHESAGRGLVGERVDPKHAGLVRIAGIENPSGKTEDSRERGVNDICRKEIREQ